MGRSTKRKDDKGGEKKRKRRKKARTDVSSDSDSSSSEDEGKVKKISAEGDVEMDDAPAAPSVQVPAILEDGESDNGDAGVEPADTGKPNEKSGQIPMELRDFHDSQAEAKFEEYYMRLVTEEFGDDLDNLRNAKDFGDKSLPLLVKALKQGINIFSADEKRTIVKELA